MTTTTVQDCTICHRRKSSVFDAEQRTRTMVHRLEGAIRSDLAPHLQRGLQTQLLKAQAKIALTKKALEDHQYGECGEVG